MAHDTLSNGRLQETTIVQRTRTDRNKKGIEAAFFVSIKINNSC